MWSGPHISPPDSTVIARRLRLAGGFHDSERDWVVHRLATLGTRLRSFTDDEVQVEISLKDRDGAGQHIRLECWIHRDPGLHLISTSESQELAVALNDVRSCLIRQLNEAKTRTEPRSNRALRHPERAAHPADDQIKDMT
ncbi:HPF/RaiA family ribosome-associated protein [Pseudonocardiaceae bacterium YIM PH 21723]|nr:HPF/RaiA family ribosome-associated protein [Pseudonocardiaceae bacterium YIM PH 21723]